MPTKKEIAQAEQRNQFALSMLFESYAKKDWVYVPPWKGWAGWNGLRWLKDDSGAIKGQVGDLIHQQIDEAKKEGDQKVRLGWLNGMLENTKMAGTASLAQHRMVAETSDFERHPMLINCLNGTLNLKTGKLHGHRKSDKLRLMTNITFNPDAECPRWHQFIDEVTGGDEAMANYLQRVVGYTLTGLTSEQCLFVLHGSGANGKSVFLSTLRAMMGEYGRTIRSDSLTSKRNDQNGHDLAGLADARYAEASETELNARMAEGLVKSVTGGEDITARFLRGNFFTYTPRFKLFLATNHKPSVHGTDDGIWRRLKLIPFSTTIAPEKRDRELTQKLQKELVGIFAWAVLGVEEWLRDGLAQPEVITKAISAYKFEMDPVAQFLEHNVQVDTQHSTKAGDLYMDYKRWCDGEGNRVMSNTAFGQIMGEKGHKKERKSSGVIYLGIKLNNVFF